MSQDRDPFSLLPLFTDPEPDPVVMNATIAQSREAFTSHQARSGRSGRAPQRNWFYWLMPATFGLAAIAVAVVVVPGLIQTTPPQNRDVVADLPTPAPSAPPTLSRGGDEPDTGETGVRMGIQPGPGQAPAAAPQLISVFEGENVRIGMRLSANMLELYLPDLTGEATIDSQVILTGEQLELLAAFRLPGEDLVAVQFRVDDTRFWRIYRPVDGAYARDTDLSAVVSDAADQAEIEQRLGAN